MESVSGRNMVQVQQNEIDLIDLFKILYKNKLMITLITVMVTLASLGGAFYVHLNTKDLIAINFKRVSWIDPFYVKKANLGVSGLEIENLFKQDDVVKEMYEVQYLNKLFLESGAPDNLNERRSFLEKKVKVKAVIEDKSLKHYQVSMEDQGEAQGEKDAIVAYLNILNGRLSNMYTSRINERHEVVKGKKEGYEKALTDIEEEIRKVISKEPKELFGNEKAWDIIQVKYPRLFERQKKMKELYVKYGDELMGIEGIKADLDLNKQIEKVSSFYEIKQSSKAKKILIVGIAMGVILGVIGAFIKEFVINLRQAIKISN